MSQPLDESATPWIGPGGQVAERLELHLSYLCNNRCRFCSEASRMKHFQRLGMSWERITAVLRKHAKRGVRKLYLTGGEPTRHPRLPDVLTLAKRLGMSRALGSNGGCLCREDYASRILPLIDEVMLSLHGPAEGVHDQLTRRRGSFNEVIRAARLLPQIRADMDLQFNTVVTRHNADVLPDTIALAAELGAKLIVVSNLSPEGRGLDNYEELAVPLEQLTEVLPTLPTLAPDAIVRFFGVPMCVLGKERMASNDLHWDPRVTVEWTYGCGRALLVDHYDWQPSRERAHAEGCDACLHRSICMGAFRRYLELYGDGALSPVEKPH